MFAQQRFQVARVDVETAADDHVLLAVQQGQEAVGVEAADIAGADEALAARIEPLGLARLAGLAVVAAHHAGRVPHHLADGRGIAGRQFAARVVDEADVVARRRPADRVQLVGLHMRFEDAGAAPFRHAVELDQPARPARHHLGLQWRSERRAGAELEAEGAQVVGIERRQGHDALVLHRHQHRVRDAVLHGQREVSGGVELLHQDHAAAEGQGREEHHQRGVRIQRRGEQGHHVCGVAIGRAAHHVRPAHAVRLHDAFRRAGGAG